MEKKAIKHPFRNISFDFDPARAWTARDEKLLNLYVQLHDLEAQRYQNATALHKQFKELNKQIASVRADLPGVKKELTALRKTTDRLPDAVQLNAPGATEDFVKQLNTFNDRLQAYDSRFRELFTRQEKLNGLLNAYIDAEAMEEENGGLWERMMELKITYGYDAHLAIDLMSFDDDYEQFRQTATTYHHKNDTFIDYCIGVLDKFRLLSSETETQYEVWNEFSKRLKLLDHLTDPDPGFPEVGLN